MSLRSRAREVVLQVLYQDDLNKDRSTDEDLAFIRNRLHNRGNITEFARELLDGVRAKCGQIDEELAAVAENWRIGRMAATDRNVLRLGAFEILFYDTPSAVAVNEAIELAKRYGNELSPTFINGILDRLIKKQQVSPANSTGSGAPNNTVDPASGPPTESADPPPAETTSVTGGNGTQPDSES